MMKRWPLWISCLLSAVGLCASLPSHAAFVDIAAGLTGVTNASLDWGDYDNDGDLDLVLIGETVASPIARIYRNNAGAFTDAGALPASAAVSRGSVAWGDYDRDGDLDLALAGYTGTAVITRIYRNDHTVFNDIGAGLAGIQDGALAWGDYDNDGDLDLAVSGNSSSTTATPLSLLYRNTSGVFTDASAGFTALRSSALAWGDYDNDGDLDLVLAGSNGTTSATHLYRNTGGTFTVATSGFAGISGGAVAWGDFDADGDLDLALCGNQSTGGPTSKIYRNTSGTFAVVSTSLQPVANGTIRWGDMDNDGDFDLVLGGNSASIASVIVYRNIAGAFADASAGLPDMRQVAGEWGDYDGDGDLDLVLAGGQFGVGITRIYRNDGTSPNTPPVAPTGLVATSDGVTVTFSWNASTDGQTIPPGLTYNLMVGTSPGGGQIVPAMANGGSGARRVPRIGNVGHRQQWSIARSALGTGTIHWTVQAIDNTFAGSAFAAAASGVLDVGDRSSPPRPTLRASGPNPFRSEARARFTLPRAARVDLAVVDLAGRRVATLARGDFPAGDHEVIWNGADPGGARRPPGFYVLTLRAGNDDASLRLLMLD